MVKSDEGDAGMMVDTCFFPLVSRETGDLTAFRDFEWAMGSCDSQPGWLVYINVY